MRLIGITTCTNRKRGDISRQLDVVALPRGLQAEVVSEWRSRVAASKQLERKASDVYCGRSFQEALLATKGDESNIWIISAGLGLVRGSDTIPPYNLSLVRGEPTFIGSHVTGDDFNPAKWWRAVQRRTSESPIAELVRSEKEALFVIGISRAYLPLISDDLLRLDESELARIRFTGLGIEMACPDRLRKNVLPYDDRLDGPDSPLPGTRGDFSSRAMRHFSENVFAVDPTGTLAAHRSEVAKQLSEWRRAQRYSRKTRSDDEILEFLLQKWATPQMSASKALRHLRDVENIACEQGRFKELFNRAYNKDPK